MKRFVYLGVLFSVVLSIVSDNQTRGTMSLLEGIFIASLIFGTIYIFFLAPRQRTGATHANPIRMAARFWAFIVDLIILSVCLSAIMVFLKSFFLQSGTDLTHIFDVIFVFASYASPIFINWAAFKLGRQTPGQYVMQFRIIAVEGQKPIFWKRILYLFSIPFLVNEKDGIFLWDRKSNTRLVSTRLTANN